MLLGSASGTRPGLPLSDFVLPLRVDFYTRLLATSPNGVIQSSGDSTGPGGLFRSIRSIPAVLEVARDIEAICPDAWVFNYINPSTIMGAALARHTKLTVRPTSTA